MDGDKRNGVPSSLRELLNQQINKRSLAEIHKNFFGDFQEDAELFDQGNADLNLPFVELGQETRKELGVVMSNSCDTSKSHSHTLPARVTYCATIPLIDLVNGLRAMGLSQKKISDFERELKSQVLSDMMYVPVGRGIKVETVVLMSLVNSVPVDYLEANNKDIKSAFTLSDDAFKLFITKISIHYLRFGEIAQA